MVYLYRTWCYCSYMDAQELIELIQKYETENKKPLSHKPEKRTLTWDATRDFYKEYEDTYMPWVGAVCHGKPYTTTEEETRRIFLSKPKDI